jgi:2-oxoglutarate dehydrogenase E2 component (dihydrolipoamide succinyltransferase)
MSAMRKSIAEHMILSRSTSAHVTTVFEADVSRIVQARESLKRTFEKEEGVKLTYTPFFIRAVTSALKSFPALNASIAGDRILYRKDYNIGVAVAWKAASSFPWFITRRKELPARARGERSRRDARSSSLRRFKAEPSP